VVARLADSAKYRHIHRDTIADVVARSLPGSTSAAELERRARASLHRVAALYLLRGRTARSLPGLDAAARSPAALRDWCRAMLDNHFSTRERLPDIDEFYAAVIDMTGPPASVADLGCALNVFTVPWLLDVADCVYMGYDFNRHYVDMGDMFLARTHPGSNMVHTDVVLDIPERPTDVALFLKTHHCVEDRRPGAALALVEHVRARHVVVSFPLRGMHGRAATFAGVHIDRLAALAERRGWGLRSADLRTERLLVVAKDGG
jgi:16S rRNA (guanine(1405)-N(7))-methyltransferase